MEEESPLKDFLLKYKMRMVLWMPCAYLHCHIQTYRGYFSYSNACFGVDVGWVQAFGMAHTHLCVIWRARTVRNYQALYKDITLSNITWVGGLQTCTWTRSYHVLHHVMKTLPWDVDRKSSPSLFSSILQPTDKEWPTSRFSAVMSLPMCWITCRRTENTTSASTPCTPRGRAGLWLLWGEHVRGLTLWLVHSCPGHSIHTLCSW